MEVSGRVEGPEGELRECWGGWSRDGAPEGLPLSSHDESPRRRRRHAFEEALLRVVVGMGQGGDSECKMESTRIKPASDIRMRQQEGSW